MVMGVCLGIMFLGISWLAAKMQVVPERARRRSSPRSPRRVYGSGTLGHVLFLFTQAATMLILVLAANTSFADFPRLASFHADDAFMPKQLTKRGHRLVFSNGIIALAIAAAVLVVLFQADVTHLIPLYAIGVFTSFTLSQAGMAKRHLRLQGAGLAARPVHQRRWAPFATGVVTVVIAITKFTHGAWVIMILVPVMVFVLVRLNRQYESEKAELAHDADDGRRGAECCAATRAGAGRARIDRSMARAIQYARTLHAGRAAGRAHRRRSRSRRGARRGVGAARARTLPARARASAPTAGSTAPMLELVAAAADDGQTEVTVLIPRREYRRIWHRFLHDRTSDSIARTLSDVPHANVTFVPYHLGTKDRSATHEVPS